MNIDPREEKPLDLEKLAEEAAERAHVKNVEDAVEWMVSDCDECDFNDAGVAWEDAEEELQNSDRLPEAAAINLAEMN
jgi:hypothetical protein